VPKRITALTPSYLHSWSPDGKWLLYTGGRNGNFDIYKMASDGSGKEIRLTTDPALDDGPEFTPDGKYIYFNSARTGLMQIWRMKPDGSSQEQVTSDGWNNWFPHISPDGQWMVWLSFPPGTEGHNDRMPGMQLRLARTPGESAAAQEIQVLSDFYGGQGTINVNSWSPDSKQFGYVIYEPI